MWKMQEHFFTKESVQRKGDPDAARFLRLVDFVGVCQERPLSFWQSAASCRTPSGCSRQKHQCSARHTGINQQLRNMNY
jgi:hypothetical protein